MNMEEFGIQLRKLSIPGPVMWRDYIATLPARDERRSLTESELAHIPSS